MPPPHRSLLGSVLIGALLPAVASARPATARGRSEYAACKRHLAAGDYQAAIGECQQASLTDHDPAILYTLAQAYGLAGDHRDAASTYRRFLAAEGEGYRGGKRAAVESLIAQEDRAATEEDAAPVTPPAPPASEPQPAAAPVAAVPGPAAPPENAWYRNRVGEILLGAGAGAVAGAAVAHLIAGYYTGVAGSEKSFGAYNSDVSTAQAFETVGIGLGIVGGALLVTGVVWDFSHEGATEVPAVTGAVFPRGGAIGLAGRF